ncbi:hypothetical protein LIER_39212 [Lithospermum erythrorhizon]|uniref:Uncharacterized protein n=1 Tax=Lithospermum erythrorhizon TaxID=34254 RepID=A0AAV3QDN0_LITER
MSSPSEISSSSPSSSSFSRPSPLRIQYVSKSLSERLLTKFSDVSEFNFHYTQSGLWSPPISRKAFINSPGRISTEHEIMQKLRTALAPPPKRRFNLCFIV